jgi:membrane-associated phospholipid phosphatase
LKGIVKQPRPPRYDDDYYYHDRQFQGALPRREHGMPSNHSCFVWFVATFVVLYVYRGGAAWSARYLPSRSHRRPSTTTTTITRYDATTTGLNYHRLHSALSVSSSLFVATGCAYSRVYLGYHTSDQVYVGSLFGMSLGAAWYALFETSGAVRMLLTRLDGTLYDLEGARYAMLLARDESDDRYGGKYE